MTIDRDVKIWRKPSAGYLVNLSFASVGITFLVIALGTGLRMRAGEGINAFHAVGHEGAVALAFSMSLNYLARLIFWGKVPPRYQAMARNLLTTIFWAELALVVVTLASDLVPVPSHVQVERSAPGVMIAFTVLGFLCQTSTVLWLLRYRKE